MKGEKSVEIRLDSGARYIIEKLNKSGKRADIVGGCVRDFLLGKKPFDYDITTEATPDEMKEIFASDRVVETGIKHGTLTVLYEGTPYEVTTYREDGEYLDHRHPKDVKFSRNIDSDLSRRDFTVNAIAYNEKDGITDLFGGISDIRKGVIRAVGDPYKRFDEDALRILRAVRFSATLCFVIEEKTDEACRALANLLSDISGERIYAEWKKLVAGDNAYSVIEKFPEIISIILGFVPALPCRAQFDSASLNTRILSLFVRQNNPEELFCEYVKRLRIDNKTARVGDTVLKNLNAPLISLADHLIALRDMGKDAYIQLVELCSTLGKIDDSARILSDEALSDKYPYAISMLDIGGEDITMLGFSGRQVGKVLSYLLEAVIFERVENERQALINLAKGYTDID